MNQPFRLTLEAAISHSTGKSTKIVKTSPVSGGCINETNVVETRGGRKYIVKTNQSAAPHFFQAEALGLQMLRDTNTIRIPEVVALNSSKTIFLVLEYIEPGRQHSGFFESFGHQLANMHRASTSDQFGFSADNFLGATPQPNLPNHSWVEFWAERRIGYQMDLACANGFSEQIDRLREPFLNRIPDVLDSDPEQPALIHGDLWSGNCLVDSNGSPVLIDPAVYYAHRESEFGMTTLFGGFDQRFYDAYCESWPFSEGWEERVEIYRLYHLLNHLNLFGQSYLSGCIEILKKYV